MAGWRDPSMHGQDDASAGFMARIRSATSELFGDAPARGAYSAEIALECPDFETDMGCQGPFSGYLTKRDEKSE